MRLHRTSGVVPTIPTASMADIAFLLLIFFIVTTIFRLESGLPVVLPRAESGVQTPKQRVTHIYIDRRGIISVDDQLIEMSALEGILQRKLQENSDLIVGFSFDHDVPYRTVDQAIEQLKRANALNTSFTVEKKPRPS